MYHEKTGALRRVLWIAALAVLLALGGPALYRRAAADLAAQSVESVRQAVLRAAAQCSAVEGVYPENLAYLEDHYGLIVNEKRYIVTYEAFASNLMPEVAVLTR